MRVLCQVPDSPGLTLFLHAVVRLVSWADSPSTRTEAWRRNGNLADEIWALDDVMVKSRPDADAICKVLHGIVHGKVPAGDGLDSSLRAVAGLFQDVGGFECDAFPVLQSRGTPLLCEAVENESRPGEAGSKDVLFVLKILVLYGTRRGAELVVRLAQAGFEPEDWLWSIVFGAFSDGHPQVPYVFGALSNPLPDGFIAVSLLDGANRFFLEGGEARHPFDSDEGVSRLREYLIDADPERFSYATSAVAALPFLHHEGRTELLSEQRLPTAWLVVKLDRTLCSTAERGLRWHGGRRVATQGKERSISRRHLLLSHGPGGRSCS